MTKVLISMRNFKEFVKDNQLSIEKFVVNDEFSDTGVNKPVKRGSEQPGLCQKRMCTRACTSGNVDDVAQKTFHKTRRIRRSDASLVEVVNIENFHFESYATKEDLMKRYDAVSATCKKSFRIKRNTRSVRSKMKRSRQKALLWAPVVMPNERDCENLEKALEKSHQECNRGETNVAHSSVSPEAVCSIVKSRFGPRKSFGIASDPDEPSAVNAPRIKAKRRSRERSTSLLDSNIGVNNSFEAVDVEKSGSTSSNPSSVIGSQSTDEKITATIDFSEDENVDVVLVDENAENCATPLLNLRERPVSPKSITRFFDSSLCARVRPFIPRNMRNSACCAGLTGREEDGDCIYLSDSSVKDTRVAEVHNDAAAEIAPINQVRENLAKAIENRQTQLVNLKIRSRSMVGEGKTVMLRVTTHIDWNKMKRKVMRFISQVLKNECCNWIDIDLFFDRDVLVRLIFNKTNNATPVNRHKQRVIDVQIMKLEPYKSTCEKYRKSGECRYGTLCGFKFHAHQLCEQVDDSNNTILHSPNLLRRTIPENKRTETDFPVAGNNTRSDPFVSDVVKYVLSNLVDYVDQRNSPSLVETIPSPNSSVFLNNPNSMQSTPTTCGNYSSSQVKAIPFKSQFDCSASSNNGQKDILFNGSISGRLISPKPTACAIPKSTSSLQCFKIRNTNKSNVQLVRLVSGNEPCSTPIYTSICSPEKTSPVSGASVAATVTLVRPIVRFMSNRKVCIGPRSPPPPPAQQTSFELFPRSDALLSHRAILRFYFKALLDVKGPMAYKRTLVQLYIFSKLIQSHSPDCQPHPDDIPNDGVRSFLNLCLDILSDALTHKDYSLIDSYGCIPMGRRYKQFPLQQFEELAGFLDDELVRFTFSSDCWTLAGLRTRLNSLLEYFEGTLHNSDPVLGDIYARLLLMLKCLRWNDQIVPREILQALFQLLISADKPNSVSFSYLAASLRRLIMFLRDILNGPKNFSINKSSCDDDSVVVLSD